MKSPPPRRSLAGLSTLLPPTALLPTALLPTALLLTTVSCTPAERSDSQAEKPDFRVRQSTPPIEKEVVIFAATSLRDVFTTMATKFERSHPAAEVTFNFAGTQELRTQLEHGAAVDVFASADLRHMDELKRASRVIEPVVFTRNEPVMVVSREAASSVQNFAELPSAARIVIGAPEVPIGRYTLQILDRAERFFGTDFRERVEENVASRELNVRQVLTKVSLGEAQAGVVYRSDARSAKDWVTVVPIPAPMNVIAEYPIALVKEARNPRLGRAWINFVLSPEGKRELESAGFSPAEDGASK